MISADRQQLAQFSRKKAVLIRQRELDLLHNTFSVIATQCSFLVAIAFVSLYMQPDTIDLFVANECGVLACAGAGNCCIPPSGMSTAAVTELIETHSYTNCSQLPGAACASPHKPPNHSLELAFFTFSSLSACFNMFAVAVASYGMIYGPALAIRGPEGSMSRAIQSMYTMRRALLRAFWLGMFCFLASIPCLGYMKLDGTTALLMTLVIVVMTVAIVRKVSLTQRKFAFDRSFRKSAFLVGRNFDPERRRTVQLPPSQSMRG